jgi:hypothetical protein
MLMGIQGGFTKLCCFLCLWDSHCSAEHYIKHDWESRKTYDLAKDSVQHCSVINPMKIFLSPRHIKPGLIKCLVKAMAKANLQGF